MRVSTSAPVWQRNACRLCSRLNPIGSDGFTMHRVAQLARRRERLPGGRRVARLRDGHAAADRDLELVALALDPLEHLPGGRARPEGAAQVGRPAGEHVHVLVMGGEGGHRRLERLAQPGQGGDEAVLVDAGIRRDDRRRVAGAEAERPRAVVDRERAHAVAAERADRGEAVHPADVGDDGGGRGWRRIGHGRGDSIRRPSPAQPPGGPRSVEFDLVEVADRAPPDRHPRPQPAQLAGVGRAERKSRPRVPAG